MALLFFIRPFLRQRRLPQVIILGHNLQLSPCGSFFLSLHPPDLMIWYMNWQLFLFQWLIFRKDTVIVKDSNDTPYFYIVKSVRMTVDQYKSLFFRARGRPSVSACPTHLRPKVEAEGKKPPKSTETSLPRRCSFWLEKERVTQPKERMRGRLHRNRKPRMKSLWQPGYREIYLFRIV